MKYNEHSYLCRLFLWSFVIFLC